ncbi:MAG: RHS repeat domain-containing protein [Vulcanimicrobiota bacterium]
MSYLYDYDDANQLQEIFSGTFQSRDEGDFTTSVETFAYDDDGDMIESDDGTNTNTFSWDTFDRLVAVEKQPADETVVQHYDTGGLRKLKTAADGTETRSHFSGLPTVSEVETPSAGSPVEISYFMGHQLLGFDRGGDFRFFLTDGLSSVRVVVDGADGSQLAYYEYDEFGQQIAYSGSVVSPKTYVGGLGVHDDTADTGLLYMRQRHYDPATARFLSRDPIGFAGGLNLYGYVGGNPIGKVDPSGLESWFGSLEQGADSLYLGLAQALVPPPKINYVKGNDIERMGGKYGAARLNEDGSVDIFIEKQPRPFRLVELNTLVHECGHYVWWTFYGASRKNSDDQLNSEVFAETLSSLFGMLYPPELDKMREAQEAFRKDLFKGNFEGMRGQIIESHPNILFEGTRYMP